MSGVALSGLYANRPPATSVAAGSTFYAFDLGVSYTSDGAAWADTSTPATPNVAAAQVQGSGPAHLKVLGVVAANAAKGQWNLRFDGAVFNAVSDSVMALGYNNGSGGGAEKAAEAALYVQWESDYCDDGVRHLMEWHIDFLPNNAALFGGLPRRPIFLGFDRGTGDNVQFELRSAGIQFTDWTTGAQFASLSKTGLSFFGSATAGTTLALQTGAGQSSSINLWYNAASVMSITPLAASEAEININGFGMMYFFGSVDGQQRRVSIGVEDSTTGIFTVVGDHYGTAVVVARASATQAGDLFRAENAASGQVWGVTVAGLPHFAVAANAQTTVGPAGGASALPATPTKYFKVVDATGTTLVMPAYAAA